LVWTGLYLAHSPGNADSSWIDGHQEIAGTWGVAPLYVGHQTPKPGKPDLRNAVNGTTDGKEAVKLAGDAQIPGGGALLYLDIEPGGLQPQNAMDYLTSW
jgi:hypothetical protein